MADVSSTAHPAATAPKDGREIEVRNFGDEDWWIARRSPDGLFRDGDGKPAYVQPDEWRPL